MKTLKYKKKNKKLKKDMEYIIIKMVIDMKENLKEICLKDLDYIIVKMVIYINLNLENI